MHWWVRPLLHLLSLLPGLLLILLSIMILLAMARAVFTYQQLQAQLVCVGLLLAVLWWAYLQLPGALRKAISKVVKRKKSGDKEHGHS